MNDHETPTALLLLSALLLAPAASADHDGNGDCTGNGLVPGAGCIVKEAVTHCTPPTILSWCYGYTLVDTIEFGYYGCDIVFGTCPL